jgi:hypothetical protein
LWAKDWVVYSQPPIEFAGDNPEPVLKYLARYVSGVAISNQRLVSFVDGQVAFRWKNYRQGGQSKPMTLPVDEFLRRFLQHVLPAGFVRVRYYGLLANRHRHSRLAHCRKLLGAQAQASASPPEPETQPAVTDSPAAVDKDSSPACLACGVGRLHRTDSWPRPTGRELRRHLSRLAARRQPEPRDTS